MDRGGPEDYLLGLAGELSTYFGCYSGRGHPGSWCLLPDGAHSASTSGTWLGVPEELHAILPPLQGGG